MESSASAATNFQSTENAFVEQAGCVSRSLQSTEKSELGQRNYNLQSTEKVGSFGVRSLQSTALDAR
jgi:hypothetical protein